MAPALLDLLLSHGRLPPSSQWLRTPARSLMSDPTRSQSRRIRSLAAANTLAAMCVEVTWRSGRDRAVQYAVHSCVMTNSLRRCQRLPNCGAGCHGPL